MLSKRDLVPDDEAARLVTEWAERLGDRVLGVLATSAATGAGLDELRAAILAAVPASAEPARDEAQPAYEAEHITYRPAAEQGFDVEPEGDGVFRVHGRGLELLVARHDLGNAEALAYLEQRLREIGVIAALQAAGFEHGNSVRIGDDEFELRPAG